MTEVYHELLAEPLRRPLSAVPATAAAGRL
jgi:hypothetical protein